MSRFAANSTKFWVVCCEENEVTQAIARTVDSWQLTGVRSLTGDRQTLLSNVDMIADASYVICVTPDERPGSQAKVHPLNMSQFAGIGATAVGESAVNEESPVDMMTRALYRHGRTPQAWLLQLPITEIRARYAQPVSAQKSVAQARSPPLKFSFATIPARRLSLFRLSLRLHPYSQKEKWC